MADNLRTVFCQPDGRSARMHIDKIGSWSICFSESEGYKLAVLSEKATGMLEMCEVNIEGKEVRRLLEEFKEMKEENENYRAKIEAEVRPYLEARIKVENHVRVLMMEKLQQENRDLKVRLDAVYA